MTKRVAKPLPTAEDILQILRERLPELRDKHHVEILGVFGFYVRGKQTRKSDLDILVEFTEAPSFFKFVGLERQLSEMIGVKVDLVMKSALKPYVGARILSEEVAVEG